MDNKTRISNLAGGISDEIIPQIYVKGSVEAVAFYQKAFGLTLGMTALNPDGTYEHVSLMSGETEILAVAEDLNNRSFPADMGDKWPRMSFNVKLGTDEAVNHAYAVLIEGARNTENPNGPGSPSILRRLNDGI